jgi:hypothetical protein
VSTHFEAFHVVVAVAAHEACDVNLLVRVSTDPNYIASLWNYPEASHVCCCRRRRRDRRRRRRRRRSSSSPLPLLLLLLLLLLSLLLFFELLLLLSCLSTRNGLAPLSTNSWLPTDSSRTLVN